MKKKQEEKTVEVVVATTGKRITVSAEGTLGDLKELIGSPFGCECSRWVFSCGAKVLTNDKEALEKYAGKEIRMLPDALGGAGFGKELDAVLATVNKDAEGYYDFKREKEACEALRKALNATEKYAGTLKLRDIIFKASVSARFGGYADFGGDADFRGSARFGGYADFGGDARFGGYADFGGYARFGGDARFGGYARFGGDADFGGDARFGGDADFRGYARFGGDADFGGFVRASTIGFRVKGKTTYKYGKVQLEFLALVARARLIADSKKTEAELADEVAARLKPRTRKKT